MLLLLYYNKTIYKVSASYQQQVKAARSSKEQSTETELTAQKLVLSLRDKQGTKIVEKKMVNNYFIYDA